MTDDRMREALEDFRDTILNQRGALAENGMTNDQVNDVLNEFDYRFGEALSPPARRTSYEWPDHTWGEGRLVYRVVWSGDCWQIQWRRPFTGEDWRNRNPAHEVSDSGIASAIATLAGLEKEES